MREIIVESDGRLDQMLSVCLPHLSRSRIAEHIAEGLVWVDGVVRKPSYKVREGMTIRFDPVLDRPPHDLEPAELEIPVLFEDDDLMVVNKPRGLATHPAPGQKDPTLVNALLGMRRELSTGSAEFRPGIVHRLDKPTTGLLLIAKTDFAHRSLAQQIAKKTADRTYIAWVEGEITQKVLRIEAPIGRDPKDRRKMAVLPEGKPSITRTELVAKVGQMSLLVVRLETGRTHQIRVHLSAIGYPVMGDEVYGKTRGTLQLHAAQLSFDHPRSSQRMVMTCSVPEDFITLPQPFESIFEIEN